MRTRHMASFALALTLGAATLAAAQSTTVSAQTDVAQATPAAATTSNWPHRHHARLFRGVHLTADQRAKVSTIRDQYRTQAKPLFHQMRSAHRAIRDAKARSDSAGVTTARTTMQTVRTQFTSLHTQWVSDVRGVLTPDQQATFDKNAAAIQAWHARHEQRS
jgi:Spy/CpxP family protein refolding chaperone